MNILILSEMRVGSRWLHYTLADLFGMGVSPEIGKLNQDTVKKINGFFESNRIAKLHSFHAIEVLNYIRNANIIGVVRNPRDRAVSLTFHNRYHHNDYPFLQKQVDTDEEAIKTTLYKDTGFIKSHSRQLSLMIPSYSTKLHKSKNKRVNYIWTAYEWMKEDYAGELKAICDFVGADVSDSDIEKIVKKHSFKNVSGRSVGEEDRKNLFARKGINKDWENWFSTDDVENTKSVQDAYFNFLNGEVDYAKIQT